MSKKAKNEPHYVTSWIPSGIQTGKKTENTLKRKSIKIAMQTVITGATGVSGFGIGSIVGNLIVPGPGGVFGGYIGAGSGAILGYIATAKTAQYFDKWWPLEIEDVCLC